MNQKEIFYKFLVDNFSNNIESLLKTFERFHSWLVAENSKINLFSRLMSSEDIWTVHFLDSLLSIKYVDFRKRKVLDFGTGGGMPGIPLAIVFENAAITLLDARKKKIAAVDRAAKHLGITNCRFCDIRLEETTGGGEFDIIVSRSVKIEPIYKPILLKLLKPRGKIVLYKGKIFDDVKLFDDYDVRFFNVSDAAIGERNIVVINT